MSEQLSKEQLERLAKQQEIAERLQLKWLERMERLLDSDEGMSATDANTLFRFLSDNGWTVDPAKLPAGLKDKLAKSGVEFSEDDEFGLRVVR